MSIGISSLDERDFYFQLSIGIEPIFSLWNGHTVTLEDFSNIRDEIESLIKTLLLTQDPNTPGYLQALTCFAHQGSSGVYRDLIEKDIVELLDTSEGLTARGQDGAIILASNIFSKTWKFFKKHPVATLLGIGLVAGAITAGIIFLTSRDALLDGLLDNDDRKERPSPNNSLAANENSPTLPESDNRATDTSFTPTLTSPLTEFINQKIIDPESLSLPSLESEKTPSALEPMHSDSAILPEPSGCLSPPLEESIHFKPNYASTFAFSDALKERDYPPPFSEIPIIGSKDQSTIHFHCGINNDLASVKEGGSCLYSTVNQELAVQPHLIHSSNLIAGLTVVGLEKLDTLSKSIIAMNLPTQGNAIIELSKIPGFILEHSKVKKSIDYEVENLSKIAQKIMEQDNPKLKQLHVPFSNAGYIFNEVLKQLSPEQQNTILLFNIGGTVIIDEKLACEVYNIIGDKDWPSQVCNGGLKNILRASEKAN